jgi:glycerophosphoryl diester phosphodiesterase
MRSSPSARLEARLAPAPPPERVAFLIGRPFAHRGLHGGAIVENSMAAFDAAIAHGYGIECDVHASSDGVAHVFHDGTLDRLTGATGPIAARTAAELAAIPLNHNAGTIPRLDQLLAHVGGRVPLLIELKAPTRRVGFLCRAVRRALEGYRGSVAVMSFNPLAGAWFAARAPRIVRGLTVTDGGKPRWHLPVEHALALWRAKPDFLAYDVRDLPSPFAARCRARGLPVLSWTVRDDAAKSLAAAHADQPIFEGTIFGKPADAGTHHG